MGSKTMTISIINGFVLCIPVDVGVRRGGGCYSTRSHFFFQSTNDFNTTLLGRIQDWTNLFASVEDRK